MQLEPAVCVISLEGYAFAAKGRVFNIAENTAILKQEFWRQRIQFGVVPPATLKKSAGVKGNATKLMMHDAFVEDTGIEFEKLYGFKAGKNPSSDLIDAYYLCKRQHGIG
jgi:hypothetical protein